MCNPATVPAKFLFYIIQFKFTISYIQVRASREKSMGITVLDIFMSFYRYSIWFWSLPFTLPLKSIQKTCPIGTPAFSWVFCLFFFSFFLLSTSLFGCIYPTLKPKTSCPILTLMLPLSCVTIGTLFSQLINRTRLFAKNSAEFISKSTENTRVRRMVQGCEIEM